MRLCLFFAPLMAASLGFLAGCGGGGGSAAPPVQAPTGLTYTLTAPVYTKGTAILANAPTSGGGAVVSYSVSPTLPAGLALSTTTGSITGTPTALAAAAGYVVTATNTGGFASATLTITVKDVAPTSLTYGDAAPIYTRDTPITANTATPTGGGPVVSYSVSPTLPAGLTLSIFTGSITGTPTVIAPAASYLVTATNSGGFATASMTITVKDVAPTSLSYGDAAPIYTRGTPITTNVATPSGGGPVVSYSVSPTLPAGLTLSITTGSITGNPSVIAASARYLVTATNSGGYATASLTLTVKDVAPASLTYTDAAPTYIKDTAIATNAATPTGGGPVVSYSVSPTLPAGLNLSTSNGSITGTPTVVAAAASYVVTATNSGGYARASLTITVDGAPSITTQPANQTVLDGLKASFTVVASGTPTPTYQWQRSSNAGSSWANVTTGTGGTTASYTTVATTTNDSGSQFRVAVSNRARSANSSAATLTVTATQPLAVTLPAQQLLQVTKDGTLTPTVSGGAPPYSYAWRKDDSALSGATAASYSLPSLRLMDQGSYQVSVTDAAGRSSMATSKLFVETTADMPSGTNPVGLVVAGNDIYLASPTQDLVLKLHGNASTPQAILIPGAPTGLALDADGNPWVTLKSAGKLARIDKTTALVTLFAVGSQPHGLALGPNNELWFTLQGSHQIGKLATSGGTPTLYDLGSGTPTGIHVGADGTVWFTNQSESKIGRLAPGASQVEQWLCAHDQGRPEQILALSSGRVLYTDLNAAAVVMFTASAQTTATSALVQPFSFGIDRQSGPAGIAVDANGFVWLTQQNAGKVTRLATDGSMYSYTLPSSQSRPTVIAVGVEASPSSPTLRPRLEGTPGANSVVVYAALSGSNQVAQIPSSAQNLSVTINALEPRRVLKGETQTFTVTVTGATDARVTWELLEGTGAGTLTQEGVYTASPTIGTYHIIARSVEDPSKFGRLEVVVYPWTTWPSGHLSLFAGNADGVGNMDGQGSAARFNRPGNVAVDANGNVYVADRSNLIIRKITPAGLVTTFAGSSGKSGFANGQGAAARFDGTNGVAVDTSGNVYVADGSTIRKITPDGLVSTLAGTPRQSGSLDGAGSVALFTRPDAIGLDTAGNIYLTDGYAIRKVTAGGQVSTLAGKCDTSGYLDGPGADARFASLVGLVVDAQGNIFVTDQGNHTIRKITAAGVVSTFAGTAGDREIVDGQGAAARFSGPGGLAVDASGNLYVSDESLIRKVSPSAIVSSFAGSRYGNADGLGAAAQFNLPEGLGVDAGGNVYVADNLNYTIRKITPEGLVSTLAGLAGQLGATDGPGSVAQFYEPGGVAVDAAGYAYIADTGNSLIRKISPTGEVSTLAGSTHGGGTTDGLGSAAKFSAPEGVALDAAGNVYVADTRNHTIRKITAAGLVSTLAGSGGQRGAVDGAGDAALFNAPQSLAVDFSGNVYVADTGNATIRKITGAGQVSTLAGSAGQDGSLDGLGSSALFGRPNGVAVDAAGNVYVSDNWTATIRKITPEGAVTTLAGLPGQASSADGPGSAAGFNPATGLAVDAAGVIYVADRDNNALRRITPDGFTGTILGDVAAGINRLGSLRDGVDLPLPTSYGALASPRAVAVGADGSLYITASHGVMKVVNTTLEVPPLNLVYTTSTATYVKDIEITSNRPRSTGGTVTRYFVTPNLPAGLALNTSTGIISGTPTAVAASNSYTVTAVNTGGEAMATLTITVKDLAPSSLTYEFTTPVYTRGTTIANNAPSSGGGAVVSYSVSPSLPAGLLLGPTTGVISGTPNAITPLASYVVTATNTGGEAMATLTITVNDAIPTGLTYTLNTAVYTQDIAISANVPSSSGGTVVSYTISPSLPAGLLLSPTSGVISGTPTAITASASYVVTATNTGGNAAKSLTITIVAAPITPVITLPTSVHPGDTWMQASIQAQTGMTYTWTAVAGTTTGTITSGQGSRTIGFSAGSSTGSFDIKVDVQNPAGYSAPATTAVTVEKGTWLVKNESLAPEIQGMARAYHSTSLLPDGKVLVAGGLGSTGQSASAEIYDATTRAWTPTGSLGIARNTHTATPLSATKVLVAGGAGSSGYRLDSSEIYDFGTGTWTLSSNLITARNMHTATRLPNSNILVVGGETDSTYLSSAEFFNASTEAWVATNAMGTIRTQHTATLLPNGKVLVVGGRNSADGDLASSELYNPETGLWAPTGSLATKRYDHTATLLPNGKVLVAGGINGSGNVAVAELYNPATGQWAPTATMGHPRSVHLAILLSNGRVLVAGGIDNSGSTSSSEIYAPEASTWSSTGDLVSGRNSHSLVQLEDGSVLAAFGKNLTGRLSSTEIYMPTLAGAAPTNLTYTTNLLVYTTDTAITPNTPGNDGGVVTTYSVSPSLPAGLALSPTTGVITGTPTAITASSTYTVTATNSLGHTSADLTIEVVAPPVATSLVATLGTITTGGTTTVTPTFSGGTAVIGTTGNGSNDLSASATNSTSVSTGSLSASKTYTLTVTNAAGDKAYATCAVTVVAAPAATSLLATKDTITTGSTTTVTPTFSGGTAVIGTTGNGSSDLSASAISSTGINTGTLSASKTYTLTVTNNAGDKAYATCGVTVVAAPVANGFTTSAATPAYGTTFTLTPTYMGGTGTITASAGPSITCPDSGLTSSAITANWFGTRTYTLTVTNAAGTFDSSTLVGVIPKVGSISAISPAAPTLNVGATQAFSCTVTGGVTNAVTWSSGGTGTWSSNTWTAPSTPGSYTITATSTEDGTTHATTTATVVAVITGTLSAPAGSLPTIHSLKGVTAEEFLASPLLEASITLPPMGAGITVNLIQIDSSGAQVGPVIATCVTDANGSYSLSAPANFVPGPSYVVRAEVLPVGSIAGYTISNFVTSTTANIDPYTQASVALITASLTAGGANISTIGSANVLAIQGTVYSNMGNVPSSATTTAALLAALNTAMTQDEETKNTLANLAAPFGITGTVKNLAGEPLAGIGIGACSFGGLTLMGVTHTAEDGTYTVHVPAGDYVIGAMNMTTTSFAASGWWTSTGPVSSQFKAGKVTVSDALVTKDFTLIAGGRLSATLTGMANPTDVPLPGMQVALCDFASGQTLTSASTGPNGSFTFNVTPGTYYVSVRNKTRYVAYGSANYMDTPPDGSGGGKNLTQAAKITVTAGVTQAGNMRLWPGHLISGTVLTNAGGSPVVGMPVRFQDASGGSTGGNGAGAESTRTDVDGQYRLWLQPGNYNALCRGQMAVNLNASASDVIQDFKAQVGKITMKLVDSSNHPISQARGDLYKSSDTSGLSQEISNSEGTLELYTITPTQNVKLGFSIYSNEFYGSSVYNGTQTGGSVAISSATNIPSPDPAAASTDLGTITLPDGAILTGFVTDTSTPPVGRPNIIVQVRMGGTSGTNKMVNIRTKYDGSFTVALPAGITLTQVAAIPAPQGSSPLATQNSVVMGAAGTTKTLVLVY